MHHACCCTVYRFIVLLALVSAFFLFNNISSTLRAGSSHQLDIQLQKPTAVSLASLQLLQRGASVILQQLLLATCQPYSMLHKLIYPQLVRTITSKTQGLVCHPRSVFLDLKTHLESPGTAAVFLHCFLPGQQRLFYYYTQVMWLPLCEAQAI